MRAFLNFIFLFFWVGVFTNLYSLQVAELTTKAQLQELSQTLHHTMHSLQIEAGSGEQQLNIEDGSRAGKAERAEWVINPPAPPGLCHEIISSIKKAVCPNGSKHFSSSTKQTRSRTAGFVSFLHNIFPILIWGRNYKATKFRNDLMAGLTLASLSIPQVYCIHMLSLSLFHL